MAESESKIEHTEITSTDGGGRRNNPNPIFSLFSKFNLFNFPFPFPFPFSPLKRDTAKPDAVEKPTETVGEYEEAEKKKGAVVVKFPHTQAEMPLLKLEAEECEQNTNPVVLWQVYAIGGFFLVKWVLARWQERRAKKGSSDDDEPSPADD